MSDLKNAIARAKFLMRNFSTQNLSAAGTISNTLDDNWPDCDYDAWNTMTDEQKFIWQEKASEWLENLEKNKAEQYKLLTLNWKNIDE